jgi:hypothetical protein
MTSPPSQVAAAAQPPSHVAAGASLATRRAEDSFSGSSLRSLALPPEPQAGCGEWFEALWVRVSQGFEWLLDQLLYFFANPSFFFRTDRAKKVELFDGLSHLLNMLGRGYKNVAGAINALPLPPSYLASYKRLLPDGLVAFVRAAIDVIGRNISEEENLAILTSPTSSRNEMMAAFRAIKNPHVKANVVRIAWESRSLHSQALFGAKYRLFGNELAQAVYRDAPQYLADIDARRVLTARQNELGQLADLFSYEGITSLSLFRSGKNH